MALLAKLLILVYFAALHLHITLPGEMALATSLAMILGLSSSDPALVTRYMVMIKNEALIRMGIGEKACFNCRFSSTKSGLAWCRKRKEIVWDLSAQGEECLEWSIKVPYSVRIWVAREMLY
jgi:hypothetical protein